MDLIPELLLKWKIQINWFIGSSISQKIEKIIVQIICNITSFREKQLRI